MFSLVKSLLTYRAPPESPLQWTSASTTEKQPQSPSEARLQPKLPYNGHPVPRGADLNPDSRFIADWLEDFPVVPAEDGTSVLVFSDYFLSESSDGEVTYDEEVREVFEDQRHLCLHGFVQIHQRLQEENGKSSPRIVRFLGAAPSHYRLEKLSPGPIPYYKPRAEQSDIVLALYQRWAMQYLAACQFVHGKGVIIASTPEDVSWLRSDYSLAIASFATAACEDLELGPWPQLGGMDFICPYDPYDSPSDRDFGQPKLDIFLWAVGIYELMNGDPLNLHFSPDHEDLRAVGKKITEGVYNDWPVLKDEKLGPCLVKAWKGEYESADDALHDVRAMLKACGRTLSSSIEDEIDGFDWSRSFQVTNDAIFPHWSRLDLIDADS